MNVVQFPTCCGAYIIKNFGHTGCTTGRVSGEGPEVVEKKLLEYKARYPGMAFLIAILNEDQDEVLGKVFKKCGFKAASKGFNKNHNHVLTTYIYANKP